jgi:hypothetical protein
VIQQLSFEPIQVWVGLAEGWRPRVCFGDDSAIGDLYFTTLEPRDYEGAPPCDGPEGDGPAMRVAAAR